MQPTESSADLVRSIHNRDSKYRVAFVILMFGVLVVMAGVVMLQARTIDQFKAQSAERAAAADRRDEENLKTAGRTNAYIQCLARFFAEGDRTELKLTDLDKCNYERNGTPVPGVDVTSSSLTMAPSPQEPTAPTPTSNPQPASPAVPTLPPTPTLPPIEPPKLPRPRICVPFTQLCIVL